MAPTNNPVLLQLFLRFSSIEFSRPGGSQIRDPIFGRILTFAYCTGSDHWKRMAKYDSSLNPATIIYVALLLYSQPLEKTGKLTLQLHCT